MKLKFCGLTRKEDIEAANETKPDFIGFVFAESRRHVSDMDAARLKEHLDPEIKTVGVFVNDEPEHIAALVRDEVIDIIQLHGGESLIEIRDDVVGVFDAAAQAHQVNANACFDELLLGELTVRGACRV